MEARQLVAKARDMDLHSPYPEEQTSDYVVTDYDKGNCTKCGSSLKLLAHKDFKKGMPAFYICHCGYVGEVGLSPVPKL